MWFLAILKPMLKPMYQNPDTYLPPLELVLHHALCHGSSPGVLLAHQWSVGGEGRALVGRATPMMVWAGGDCSANSAGPHAAHSPQVGHVWFKACLTRLASLLPKTKMQCLRDMKQDAN